MREATLQHVDDLCGLVDRQRRLRDVRNRSVGRQVERLGLLDGLDEHGRVGRFAHGADHLLVPGMADQHDAVPLGRIAPRLHVHLRHERAGGVDRVQAAFRRAFVDRRRDTVRGEHERRATGHVRLVLDKDGAALFELAHHVRVVDDLLAYVNGRAVQGKRPLHRLHGALDSGAIPPRRCEQDPRNQTAGQSSNDVLPALLRTDCRFEPLQNRKRLAARGGRWRRASS